MNGVLRIWFLGNLLCTSHWILGIVCVSFDVNTDIYIGKLDLRFKRYVIIFSREIY